MEGKQWYTPPNHKTAQLDREEIIENLRKEVAAGRMFGPYSPEEVATVFDFFQSIPLGTALNLDGSVQPINDLSFLYKKQGIPSVNSFVDQDNFSTTWDNFKTIARFFKQDSQTYSLGLFDWEKA
jgi:hypothetical protein